MPSSDVTRQQALAHLDTFVRCILPNALRRIAAWKGQPRHWLAPWRDDLRQELAVDCLCNADQIVALAERERHRRWLRLTNRALYRLRGHTPRRRPLDPGLPACAAPGGGEVELPWHGAAHLLNGRLNLSATHRRLGCGRVRLRRRVDHLVKQLGWTEEREEFWIRRAAEALVGMAADQLQLGGCVQTVRPLPAPDLARRSRRLRQLVARLPVRRSTLVARRALHPWRRPPFVVPGPRMLLAHAVAMVPQSGAAWLWTFEACAAEGDLAGAARAVRRARACADVDRAAQVLARARLGELRGRVTAGLALLRRARRRWPGAATLLSAATPPARPATGAAAAPG